MIDDNDDGKRRQRILFNRLVSFKAEEMSPESMQEIDPSLIGKYGIFTPEQFVTYGTYTGDKGTEYLCEIYSLDENFPVHTAQELEQLRNDVINAASLSRDGFLSEGVLKFDFELDDWVDAPEHHDNVTRDYFFYDNNDEFLDLLINERERRIALKSGIPPEEPDAP